MVDEVSQVFTEQLEGPFLFGVLKGKFAVLEGRKLKGE